MNQRWPSLVGHLPAGTSSSGNKQRQVQKYAGPQRGMTTGVKLTPATERHVHFPASMHDVPPAARRKEGRRKNEARVVLENLKVVPSVKGQGDFDAQGRVRTRAPGHKCSALFWRGRRAPIAGRRRLSVWL